MPEPLLERLRREVARKAALTPEQKVEEYFVFRTKLLTLEHFGSEELDPAALLKKDPAAFGELWGHILWEVTDNLDDTIARAEESLEAHNTLIIGARILMDQFIELPQLLQTYMENEPDLQKRGRGRPPQTEAKNEYYLDLIRNTTETLGVKPTRNAASVGVSSACDHIEAIANKRGLVTGYSYSNLSRIWEERKKSL